MRRSGAFRPRTDASILSWQNRFLFGDRTDSAVASTFAPNSRARGAPGMSACMAPSLLSRYEELREALLTGNFDPSRLPDLRKLLVDPARLRRLDAISERAGATAFDETSQDELYALLMTDAPHWELLHAYLASKAERRIRQVDTDPGRPFDDWGWAYLAEAAIVAHECTGDGRFLDIIDTTFPSVLRARDSERGHIDQVRGRALGSWGVTRAVSGCWTNVVTTPGRIGLPVCLFVERRRAAGSGSRADVERWDGYIRAVEEALAEFEEDYRETANGEGYYQRPIKCDVEPLNHGLSAGRTFLQLYRVTGNPKHRQRATALGRFFRNSLVDEPGGLWGWAYQPTVENRLGEFPTRTWKGDIDVSFAVMAYENGVVFGKEDIDRFIRVFLETVCLGDNRFNTWITTTRRKEIDWQTARRPGRGPRWSRLNGVLTWMALAPYASRVRSVLDEAVARRRDIFPRGWLGAPSTALAYAQRAKASRDQA